MSNKCASNVAYLISGAEGAESVGKYLPTLPLKMLPMGINMPLMLLGIGNNRRRRRRAGRKIASNGPPRPLKMLPILLPMGEAEAGKFEAELPILLPMGEAEPRKF